MKLFKIFAALVLGLSVSSAQAAIAAAGASLDWSSLVISSYALGPGVAPSISWSTVSTIISADTLSPNANQAASSFDWSSALVATAGNAATSAGASASSSNLSVLAGDTDYAPASIADSIAFRSGSFVVNGTGLVVFTINYATSALLQPGSLTPNYAYAYAGLSATKGTTVSTASDVIDLTAVNTNGNTISHTGGLSLALLVQNGDLYSFTAATKAKTAVSAVPVPSAVWLFGTAMISFLGIKRRQTA